MGVIFKSLGLASIVGAIAAGVLLANTNYFFQNFLLVIMVVVFRMIVVYLLFFLSLLDRSFIVYRSIASQTFIVILI